MRSTTNSSGPRNSTSDTNVYQCQPPIPLTCHDISPCTQFHGIPSTSHGIPHTCYVIPQTSHGIPRCIRFHCIPLTSHGHPTDFPRSPTVYAVFSPTSHGIPRNPQGVSLYPDPSHGIPSTFDAIPWYFKVFHRPAVSAALYTLCILSPMFSKNLLHTNSSHSLIMFTHPFLPSPLDLSNYKKTLRKSARAPYRPSTIMYLYNVFIALAAEHDLLI